MKRFFCFILCITIVLALCGCDWYNETNVETEANDNRMTLIFSDGFCIIYRDNETGVQYFSRGGSGTCVMVDADGSPYIRED